MDFGARTHPKRATIDAVITRADGTQVNLGVVDAYYKNPVKQWWWNTIGKRRAHLKIARANQALREEK